MAGREKGRTGEEVWDRRRLVRLALPVPVVVSGGPTTVPFCEEVTTEQMSVGALAFRTEAWDRMPVGARVVVGFETPSGTAESGYSERIARIGRVVRVEQSSALRPDDARTVVIEMERSLHYGNWPSARTDAGS